MRHQIKVVSTIDAVLTIVGGFHDVRCVIFFLRCKPEISKNRKCVLKVVNLIFY